ncbi:MAG TPA: mechanosensitive ion channel domain-containing protein [Bacillota bacterium]|nr:mechanosensitive ion channel domain-containing protein [Bacillota bacterium]
MGFLKLGELVKFDFSLIITIIVVILLISLFNVSLKIVKKKLLKKSKNKKQISNVKIFTRILNIAFVIFILFIAFFSYIGSWTGLGVVVGLLTAALGFALQRPITGVAAWIMVVIKRPFSIGDRIVIGDIRGDVYDISLTHIYIDEVGGLINSDAPSGRNVMIPNYLLFEQNIINYNLTDDYILGNVSVDVTYESNMDKAMKIAEDSAKKFVKDYFQKEKQEIRVRVKMKEASMEVRVLFYVPAKLIYEISSNITKEIYDRIKKEKNVEIAYPHTEIVFKDKNLFKKR